MKKFIFLASVDQGKSTIAGNILYQTGNVDQHLFEKTQAEVPKRQIWSALLDIYEQERVRGKTFEYSSVEFKYQTKKYTMLDCPGHGIYIRSTIEAIYEDVKIACFVVNVSEFESGFNQGTAKEHLILARAVGIEHIIVCINHMDTIDWDEKLYNETQSKIDKFLKTLRFKTTQYVPVSGYQGTNIVKRDTIYMPWYIDESLMEMIARIPVIVEINAPIPFAPELSQFKFHICHCKSIICDGYQCIAHIDKKEYEIELVNVINTKGKQNIKYAKIGDIIKCQIAFLNADNPATIIKNRIILRSEDYTVGYGMLLTN